MSRTPLTTPASLDRSGTQDGPLGAAVLVPEDGVVTAGFALLAGLAIVCYIPLAVAVSGLLHAGAH